VEEKVIEKPGVPDEVILGALETCYSLRASGLEFIPHGLDAQAWAYRVDAAGGPYFLKVNRGSVSDVGAWVPAYLAGRGLENVVAPLAASDGRFVARADGLSLRLQPFIEGRRGIEGGLPARAWTEFGAFLRQLHSLDLAPELASRLKTETFDSRRWEQVAALNTKVEGAAPPDRIADELFAFWRGERDTVAAVLERTRALSQKVKQVPGDNVLCHADVHTANTLLTDDGRLYVIDWDDAMLAPKERDLMFVLADAGAEDRVSFGRGYGDAEIDPLVLAYYQHAWCVEDIGAFAEEVLDVKNSGEASRANSLSWFKSMFADGNSIATALMARTASRL
jgi:spectinomycin phosphotransferase